MDENKKEFSIADSVVNKRMAEEYNRALELQKQKPIDRDENNPDLSRHVVTEKSAVACGDGLICFYCDQGLGSYHRKDCDHICKDVKIRAVVEYTITAPSTWLEDELETYAELEADRMGLFETFELEKVIAEGPVYFNEYFHTHLC